MNKPTVLTQGQFIGSPSISVPGGSTGLVGDYYVDAVNGNDANNGLTRATAFRTVNKVNSVLAPIFTPLTFVFISGTYVGDGFLITNTNNVTLQMEEGCVFNTSGFGSGITIFNGSTLIAYLRGAEFIGTSTSSANGIGGFDNCTIHIYGAAADGTRAHIHSYDDGISLHGVPGPITQYLINDVKFSNCTKGAFVHVNSSWAIHNNCIFEAKATAILGIGNDQSTQSSQFYDCVFTPAVAGDVLQVGHADNCVIGTLTLLVSLAFNRSFSTNPILLTDCFINSNGDAPRDTGFTWTRCYGFFSFRIRGPVTTVGNFVNCIFSRRAYATIEVNNMANGSFDGGSGLWLGGNLTFVDTVIVNYSVAFKFASTTQRDSLNANWAVTNCAMFNNTTNFQSGLTLGTNLVTTDPILGDFLTTSKASWGYAPGSPCIGAGTGGSNIGFAAS